MKVIINKTGRKFVDTTELLRSIEDMNLLKSCEIQETKEYERCVEYYCTHCGCQLQGIWVKQYLHPKISKPYYNLAQQELDLQKVKTMVEPVYQEIRYLADNVHDREKVMLSKLTHCPICGAELKREEGYFFSSVYKFYKDIPDIPSTLTRGFEYDRYHEDILVEEKEQTAQMAIQFAENCDLPSTAIIPADTINSICSTSSNLKEYLHHLIELEIGIYSLTQRLKSLYDQRLASERKVILSKCLPEYKKRAEIEGTKLQLQHWSEKVEQYKKGEIGIPLPPKPTAPVLGTPSLFNKKKVLAENEALEAKYQSNLKNYENQIKEYELKKEQLISNAETEIAKTHSMMDNLKRELAQISQSSVLEVPAIAAKKIVDEEIKEAETLLKEMYKCRNRLYAYNIVFGKYRNAVALSTFYEYLMAGRCTSLEGADGAYNLYENQIRADMIIGQLSQVIEKLDEIKETQYMIYSELQTVNKSLNHLNETMDTALVSIQNMEKDIADIALNTKVIAHNSAVSAYYSKLNAELTNSLGYMLAFK